MSPRDRRALRVGAGLVLAGVLLLRILPAGLAWVGERRESLRAQQGLLDRSRSELAGLAAFEDSAKVIRERVVALAPDLFGGPTATEAAAGVAGQLNATVGRHRARVLRLEPEAVQAGNTAEGARAVRRVRVQVSLESDLAGLVETIAALESGRPGLVVRSARLQAGEPAEANGRWETMTAHLTVEGLYLASSARAAEPEGRSP